MRVGVVVCGANGERGVLLEKAIEEFARKYFDKTIQISASTVAVSPLIMEMSGIDPRIMISVNGCRNKCSDLILEKGGIIPRISIVMDDSIDREIETCQSGSSFVFPNLTEDEAARFAAALGKAVDDLLNDIEP